VGLLQDDPTPPFTPQGILCCGDLPGRSGDGDEMGDQRSAAAGEEPDYRFTLANERTFLAWVRTALALDAGGLAVIQFLPPLAFPGAREAVGGLLVALGTIVALTTYRRWTRIQQAMRLGQPLPASRLPALLAVSVSLVSIVAAVLLVAATVG
jgi:putative membrane protein